MLVIHTREGFRPNLADVPLPSGTARTKGLGWASRPLGRALVRGEPGHDIIPELYPLPGETVVDKPGHGAFYATDLELILQTRRSSS